MKTKLIPEEITSRSDIAELAVMEVRRQPYGTYCYRSIIRTQKKQILWESNDFDTHRDAVLHSIEIVNELGAAEAAMDKA